MRKILILTTFLSLLFGDLAFGKASTKSLQEQLAELRRKISLIERQNEIEQEKNATNVEKYANVEFGKKGLRVTSPDKSYEFLLNGYAQFDSRNYITERDNTGSRDDFILRRLRPALEVKSGDASFRFMPDFSGNSTSTKVFDAYVDYKLTDAVQLRFGKFKPPVSLERLQSATDMLFIERGHPAGLAPNRDIGLQLYGQLVPDILEYQVAVINGTADLGNPDGDDDSKKDVAARFFATPFRNSDIAALQDFSFGVGGTYGDRKGSTTRTILGTYKTPAQQDFFRYRSDSFASGTQWRVYPQAYWFYGHKGIIAEYAISNQKVANGNSIIELQNTAWQVAGSYVLTGEKVDFKNGIKPFADFHYGQSGIGAWELVARIGQTKIDKKAFPILADSAIAANKASSYGVGLNWYLSETLKLALNYEFTGFKGGAVNDYDRQNENIILSRVQLRF